MLFQSLSILGLTLVGWWIISAKRNNSKMKTGFSDFIVQELNAAKSDLINYKQLRPKDYITFFKKIVYLIAVLSALALGITGFFPVIFLGSHLSGILLIIHVSVAPIFAVCMALIALFWAHQNRFLPSDWIWFKKLFYQDRKKKLALSDSSISGARMGYWLLLTLSLPLILSILLSMFKFFGTAGQAFLLYLHGYSALFFIMIALVHTYLVILHHKKQ